MCKALCVDDGYQMFVSDSRVNLLSSRQWEESRWLCSGPRGKSLLINLCYRSVLLFKHQKLYIYIYYIYIYIIYIYIIYVWKLNQTVLELDFWAVKLLFFPRRDLNSHHWYTVAPFAYPYFQLPRPLDHIHSLYIYIYYIYI